MPASKSLPPRPSVDSLRKQAKRLSRDRSLPLRDAQLALARAYGFPGWADLIAEVHTRLGKGLEHAIEQARHLIHNNDVDRLKQLLAEHPALLSWHSDGRSLLGFATGAYGDALGPEREAWFTRKACAEVLIDAGAIVTPEVIHGLIDSRAVGLLQLFHHKGLLPHTLKFFAALGDLEAVRALLHDRASDRVAVNEAFIVACRFKHERVASLILERVIQLTPDLDGHIEESIGRASFITALIDHPSIDVGNAKIVGPWKAFVMGQVLAAIHEANQDAFADWMRREPWLLGDDFVWFQTQILETATLNDRESLIAAFLDLGPAILRRQPPPSSSALEIAFTYAKTRLLPLLTRIWPIPDDLAHAAGMGDLARVKRWFVDGVPVLGSLEHQYPGTSPHLRMHDDLQWGRPAVQHVLDTALAWAVINRHFDVADFLLDHGADINTNWNSHEPASILHHLVFQPDPYESMQFLIDRGIDLTIHDYRWDSTAKGWAQYALRDHNMVRFLEEAEQQHHRG